MREEILGHRGGLFRQLDVLSRLDVFADRRGGLTAVDRAQRVASPDGVPDLDAEIDDLPAERHDDAGDALLVELDLASHGERVGDFALHDRFNSDRGEHLLIERHRTLRRLRLDRFAVGGGRRRIRMAAGRRGQRGRHEHESDGEPRHCTISIPTAAFKRVAARRRPARAST